MFMDRIKNKSFFYYLVFWGVVLAAICLNLNAYHSNLIANKTPELILASLAAVFICIGIKFPVNKCIRETKKVSKYINSSLTRILINKNKFFCIVLIAAFVVLYKFLILNSISLKHGFAYFILGILIHKTLSIIGYFFLKDAQNSTLEAIENSAIDGSQNAFNASALYSVILICLSSVITVIVCLLQTETLYLLIYLSGIAFCSFYDGTINCVLKVSSLNASIMTPRVENNLTENDKRNPITLLKDVAGNILKSNSDITGLLETYIILTTICFITGRLINNIICTYIPIIFAANIILTSTISLMNTKLYKTKIPEKKFLTSALIGIIINVLMIYRFIELQIPERSRLISCFLTGIIYGYLLYFSNKKF